MLNKILLTIISLLIPFSVLAAPTSTIVQNLFISALSGNGTRCLQITTAGLVGIAGAGCASGGSGALPTSTSWVDSQILFGELGGFATSSLLLTFSTSTGQLIVGSSSFINVSSTNITASSIQATTRIDTLNTSSTTGLTVGTLQATGQSSLQSASGTNMLLSGYLFDIAGRFDLQIGSTTGGLTIGGNFQSNAGQSTFSSVSSTNLFSSGGLNFVSGSSTNNFTIGGTLQANSGQTTLGSVSSTNQLLSGYLNVGTRLDVLGNASTTGFSEVASSSKLGGQIYGGTCIPTAATNVSLDLDACRDAQWIATANTTTTLSHGRNGGYYAVTIVQDGTGSRITGFGPTSSIIYADGVNNVATTTINCWNSWLIRFSSSTYYFIDKEQGCSRNF